MQFLKRVPLPLQITAAVIAFLLAFLAVSIYADRQIHDNHVGVIDTHQTPSLAVENLSIPDRVHHALLRWDTGHYMNLVVNGYNTSEAAFFPLYPVIVTGVSMIFEVETALLLVGWFFAIAAAIVLFYWIRFELKERKVKISPWVTLGLVAIFPTSFFFFLGYTESLFFFLAISSIYAYRTKHYFLAGIFVAFATATRVPGGALAVFFLVDYLFAKKWGDWKKLIPVVMAPLGMAAYMLFLWQTFDNPFQFIAAQHEWGRLSGNPIQNLISSFTPIFFWFLPVLIGGLWLIYKKLGVTWLIYSLVFIGIPLLSGRLDSMNRYMLTLPPLFLALTLYSQTAPKWLKLLFIATSAFLLAWGVIFFANNYWVA